MSSATSVGVRTNLANYLPHGHNYGGGYAWSEPAGCWIVGSYGRLYAMNTQGVILSELSIYDLSSSLNYQYRISQVQVLPSGRIAFAAEFNIGVVPGSQNCWNIWNNFSNSSLLVILEPVLSPADLPKARIQAGPAGFNTSIIPTLAAFVEEIGSSTPLVRTETVYAMGLLLAGSNPTVRTAIWSATNNTWTDLGNSSVVTTGPGQGWHVGFRVPLKLIQDTPCSINFTKGFWRLIGAQGFDSQASYGRLGTSTRLQQASFGSFSTTSFTLDNTTTTLGYGLSCHQYSSGSRAGITVAAIYDETLTTPRIFTSINGRMGVFRGYFLAIPSGSNYRYVQLAVTKFGYTTAYLNTSTSTATATAYVWNNNDFFTPQTTLTTTSGNGQMTLYPTGKISWQNFGAAVDAIYTVSGIPDDIKFYIAIDDGLGNLFYLNNGQSITVTTLETGLYRSEDVYSIPNGYSLKLRADTGFSLATLLTISENS